MEVSAKGRRRNYRGTLFAFVVQFLCFSVGVLFSLDEGSVQLVVYLLGAAMTAVGGGYALRKLRTTASETTSAAEIRAEQSNDETAGFPIRGGQCTLTEEELLIETDLRTLIRQLRRKRSPLLAVAGLGVVGAWGGAAVILVHLLGSFAGVWPVESWSAWFDTAVGVTAGSGLLLVVATAVGTLYWSLGTRWSQREGTYPADISTRTVVPLAAVERVSTASVLGRTAVFVHYTSDGDDLARPMYLRKGEGSADLATVRSAFEAAGVPFEAGRSTAQ